ncbi:MAG: hypothetical protein ACRDI2_18475 [Chloroflexota bacterium]
MTTQTMANRMAGRGRPGVASVADVAEVAPSASFERIAGLCAVLAGLAGFAYAVAFIVLRDPLLSALFLMVGGLFTSAAMVGVYGRLRHTDASAALYALALSMAGAFGAAIHGGYDLANAINPPPSLPDLPSAVDPRGLLTFGVAGLGILAIAWLIGRGGELPRGLGWLGYLLAALLLMLYVGRLVILTPEGPAILVPALLTGFVVNPVWLVWLGISLWRERNATWA